MIENDITMEEEKMLEEVQKLLPASMTIWEINKARQLFNVGVTIQGIADDIMYGGMWQL